MTTLYLVRHAIAEERGPEYADDTRRPISSRGRRRMKAAARGFADLDPGVDRILTSPLVRAVQTAEILSRELSDASLGLCPPLAPDHRPEDVAGELGRTQSKGAIVLVGHEPDLGALAAWLLGARAPLPFKKGGIARIDVTRLPPGQDGTLVWMATPKMLRSLR
jgi:phosphohistidine phosphatase